MENLILTGVVLLNLAAVILVVRIAWWAFKKVVRGTGQAWRGE